ncbi:MULTISPECIES: TetR-like C-terminal domain-containing protein [unclassified Clostridium]|uniref:TetR/AcrR family transcriptional regulator n=1 Tax=unclassified Clostridium TaxID=2614128 RepID=UPI0002975043|nr:MULTISPECIES: TetR-like C-terminal domain-containing protein [unclassified Clostridium]EKQ56188.1 MAG: hypothetical protein A370_02192 [Clostridium sp. Maddingley MBC34-26]
MNKRNNERFQNTELKIQQTLLDLLENKDFSKITVREICTSAHINRSTFYSHYLDAYDLIDKTELNMHKKLVSLYVGTGISKTNFLSTKYITIFLNFIYEYRNFYRVRLQTRKSFPIEQGFEPLLSEIVKPYCQKKGFKSEDEMMYFFVYLQAGFTMMIKRWVDNDFNESPEELSEIILKCISNGFNL